MFGKSKPPPGKALTDRVRQVTRREPAFNPDWSLPPPVVPKNAAKRDERQPSYRQGVVQLPDGQRFTVVLKNVSPTGARIEYFIKNELPDEIVIIEPTMKIRHRARVVWQGDGVAGIAYLEEEPKGE